MIWIALTFFIIGIGSFYAVQRVRLGKFETLAAEIIQQAESQCETMRTQDELELKEKKKEFEALLRSEKQKLLREEEHLRQKEEKLEGQLSGLEKKLLQVEKKELELSSNRKELEQKHLELKASLEKIAGLSSTEAKTLLMGSLEQELKSDRARLIRSHLQDIQENADKEAKRIITTTIQRMASSTASEITATLVSLPNEEMKGRIIGREGRNIRSFEKEAQVTLIMDDTPQAVAISSFDPVRRHIAKLALTELILSGRIHPTSIEEAIHKAKEQAAKEIKQFGEDAAFRLGIVDLHPEMLTLLGKLKYRYSLGQNVLDHSVEVAHLMGIMAAELHLNSLLATRIGLLHDIGKAVSHEIQGTHALVGQELALKYGESKECANGIGCHHFEIEAETLEASLCSAADAISASRPGARIESAHEYVRRLKQLEELALALPGVENAYALQAGRELRVITIPDQISDDEMILLAKNLTKKIQNEMAYPGKIKVTVLREKRVVDYAM